jgi:hypothetical protein
MPYTYILFTHHLKSFNDAFVAAPNSLFLHPFFSYRVFVSKNGAYLTILYDKTIPVIRVIRHLRRMTEREREREREREKLLLVAIH